MADSSDSDGTPVGRRAVLGLLGLGAAGILGGKIAQDGLANLLAPVESHDPTGLVSLIPLGEAFRYYSVTGSVPTRTAANYTLDVGGLVGTARTYTLADLQGLPQIDLVRDFHCVTGWRVPQVHWRGVLLSDLLDAAGPTADATAVQFHSFDGTYTENLTLDQARRPDIMVALQMLGKDITHNHGGPVRMYNAPMYGYKSTKWLSGIELTSTNIPGYWENRGYALDGWIDD